MACENGECVVYEEYDKSKYIKLLGEYIRKFVGDKTGTLWNLQRTRKSY